MSKTRPGIAVSHPTGNANVRAVIESLDRNEMLRAFFTCIATDQKAAYLRLLPASLRSELLRRSFNIDQRIIRSFPLREMARLAANKFGLQQLTSGEKAVLGVEKMYRDFDNKVSQSLRKMPGLDAVYAYEDGALSTFEQAKKHGLACMYDLPIGYWKAQRRLMQNELENRPEWASTLTGFKDSEEKLDRKDREINAAEQIFVASSFTKSTLSDYDGALAPIEVIPYGFPPPYLARTYEPLKNRPLRLLFVGGLSQRKGIAEVFEAVAQLPGTVSLTVIGRKAVEGCRELDNGLSHHRYIPSLPHAAVLREMRQHDVLLFPSLFEGFGLVVTEAMSQGTPVITTDRTCGPDLINQGKNGWIVEAGSTDALKNQIEEIISQPEILEYTGKNALKTAGKRPWAQYGAELCAALEEVVGGTDV